MNGRTSWKSAFFLVRILLNSPRLKPVNQPDANGQPMAGVYSQAQLAGSPIARRLPKPLATNSSNRSTGSQSVRTSPIGNLALAGTHTVRPEDVGYQSLVVTDLKALNLKHFASSPCDKPQPEAQSHASGPVILVSEGCKCEEMT